MGRAPVVAVIGLALVAVCADLGRAPGRQLTGRALVGAIHLYRATVARVWPTVGLCCRFEPSCSHYAESVILSQGAVRGSFRALGRVARCNPWTPSGTVDLPPSRAVGPATVRAVAERLPGEADQQEVLPWQY